MTLLERVGEQFDALMTRAINAFIARFIVVDKRPVLFDIDATNPALRRFERALPTVQAELSTALQEGNLRDYHDLDPAELEISAPENGSHWKVFMLYAYGHWPAHARRLCPELCTMLSEIPDLYAAFFSILDGGKNVPGHCGPLRNHIRYHLGLRVPAENKPFMRVHTETLTWEVGKSFMFDDTWRHEVVNKATERRIVLIVDVLRPLPSVAMLVNRLFSRVLVPLIFGKMWAKKLG